MIITATTIEGAFVLDLEQRTDNRGYFARTWCAREFRDKGLNPEVAQINTARSLVAGTLRGMHFQSEPHAEIKLVRCTRGAVFDVVLDLRPRSPTFCRWHGVELNDENGRALYIPEGCAHGYITLADNTDLMYQASVPYAPNHARGVRYNDPAFDIQWPRAIRVVSDADGKWPDFVRPS